MSSAEPPAAAAAEPAPASTQITHTSPAAALLHTLSSSTDRYVCVRCLARCLGISADDQAKLDTEQLYRRILSKHQLPPDTPYSIDNHTTACTLCLGILQNVSQHIEQITQHAIQSKLTSTTFQYKIGIPTTLIFRNTHFYHTVLAPLSMYVSDLKETIKAVYMQQAVQISPSVQWHYNDDSDVEITAIWHSANTAEEVAIVGSDNKSVRMARKRQKLAASGRNSNKKYNESSSAANQQPAAAAEVDEDDAELDDGVDHQHSTVHTNGNSNPHAAPNPVSQASILPTDQLVSTLEITKLMSSITPTQWHSLHYNHTNTHYCTLALQLKRQTIFLGGHYNKYSRELSQTAWIIDFDTSERKTASSVEEDVTYIINQHFRCAEIKFTASGREDSDVRMLGKGRPFFLELINAQHTVTDKQTFAAMQQAINAGSDVTHITNLHLSDKQEYDQLQRSVEDKEKAYRCVCYSTAQVSQQQLNKLNSMTNLTIQQQTPIRVLHRRAWAVRPKTILSMRATYINQHYFDLDVVTSAGTYVKEFVHGDRGRTLPNVGTLLNTEADILQLDVLDIYQ